MSGRRNTPKGAGGVFTFGLKGGRETGAKFIDSLRLFTHVANVGDVRSLVIHPATTTHSQLSDEQLAESGITPETTAFRSAWRSPRPVADLEQAINAAVGK